MTGQYIYRDNSKPNKPILFACEANGILEADYQFEKVLGKTPIKTPYIGCEVIFPDYPNDGTNLEKPKWVDPDDYPNDGTK